MNLLSTTHWLWSLHPRTDGNSAPIPVLGSGKRTSAPHRSCPRYRHHPCKLCEKRLLSETMSPLYMELAVLSN